MIYPYVCVCISMTHLNRVYCKLLIRLHVCQLYGHKKYEWNRIESHSRSPRLNPIILLNNVVSPI